MPYLQLDLPGTYPVQVKRELATRRSYEEQKITSPSRSIVVKGA
jgi:hypothetical protein